MTPKQQRRLVFTIALLIGSALIIGLVIYAVRDNADLFMTPKDVKASPPPVGATFRLGGMVKVGTFIREEGELDVEFVLTDYEHEVKVVYNKILPDLFREEQGIIALGSLNAEGAFVAQDVLAKHDENYMPKELYDAMKSEHSESTQGKMTP